MESAREWLEQGNCLSKSEEPKLANLGDYDSLSDQAIAHLESIQKNHPAQSNPDLLSVAVDDIKVLTGLMKVVVAFGIYRNIPSGSMLNLQDRLPLWPLPSKNQGDVASQCLESCVNKLIRILRRDDDVARLMLISPFMVDLLAGSSMFSDAYQELVSKLPTFSLYKLLVKLPACPEPPRVVVSSLQTIILDRKDAVRTLVELVTESREETDSLDLTDIDKAVLVFASVPPQVSSKQYIDCLGDQFYSILSTKASVSSSKMIQACVLSIVQLDKVQQKLLGRLRNLLIGPFVSSELSISESCTFSNSAGAILNLIESSSSIAPSSFIQHVILNIIVSLWLLNCSAKLSGPQKNSVFLLCCKCLDYHPRAVLKLVRNLLVSRLPHNLDWSVPPGVEPSLHKTVTAPQEEGSGGLLKQMETRITSLATLVSQLEDTSATQIIISLMESYASTPPDSNDVATSLNKLLLAKAIETLSNNAEIKRKLFDDPKEIIDFSFTIISPKATQFSGSDNTPSSSNKLLTPTLEQLTLGDSDDEDESEDISSSNDAIDEDNSLLEIALTLLGGALMEAIPSEDSKFEISEEKTAQLKILTSTPRVPKTIRARADFCYELVTGSHRTAKEVDMENNDGVLAAARDALREPLVPSRAYGIHLISVLVSRHAIPLKTAFEFYANELGDEDSYIYLNAIKGIEDSTKHERTEDVIELLIPLTNGSDSNNVDRALRAREALIRVLTPGSVQSVSSVLLTSLLEDLRASAKDVRDVRFRLSSASLIGIIIAQFPLSVPADIQNEIADCALGILRHEQDSGDTSEALRRSVVVLALELVNGINEGSLSSINDRTIESLLLEINDAMQNTNDPTLKEHCQAVLDSSKMVL